MVLYLYGMKQNLDMEIASFCKNFFPFRYRYEDVFWGEGPWRCWRPDWMRGRVGEVEAKSADPRKRVKFFSMQGKR